MSYTPGYTSNATSFMARRSLATHGGFVMPLLSENLNILDLGCGPGSLTLDLAAHAKEGRVTGVDRSETQIEQARNAASEAGMNHVKFLVGNADSLNLTEGQFDLIFSHALFEHLHDPITVLHRLFPLLRSGGHIALRSPDWGGWVLYPEEQGSQDAIGAYESLQRSNGGDPHAGRKLGSWLSDTGFVNVNPSASYEIYPSTELIAQYLALQLDASGAEIHAGALRLWSKAKGALFAQSWFEAIAQKP